MPSSSFRETKFVQIAYKGLDVSTRTMIESIYKGEFLCKNVNQAWDFLEDLSGETYQWETIRQAHSIASKIFL